MLEVYDIIPDAMENYIGAKIIISNGDTLAQGSVRQMNSDVEGNNIGRANSNLILYTRIYEV